MPDPDRVPLYCRACGDLITTVPEDWIVCKVRCPRCGTVPPTRTRFFYVKVHPERIEDSRILTPEEVLAEVAKLDLSQPPPFLSVPWEYREDFETDIRTALRDLAGLRETGALDEALARDPANNFCTCHCHLTCPPNPPDCPCCRGRDLS